MKTIKNNVDKIIERIIDYNFSSQLYSTTKRLHHFGDIFMNAARTITRDTALRILLDDQLVRKCAGELKGNDEQEQYQYYNEVLLQDETYVNQLLKQYPELERLLTLQLGHLLTLTEHILDSLEQNHRRIVCELCDGKEFFQIEDMNLLISDPHNQGKRAVKVLLDNGVTLFYKPRRIEKKRKYQKLYHYISEQSDLSCRKVGFLDCTDHGWEECIEQKSCDNQEEVKRYYTRIGIHLFLAYVLSATDLHGENLIADGEYPVIVDFETFPGTTAWLETDSAEMKIKEMLDNSVLRTGILPVLTWGKGNKAIVISALNNGQKVTTPFRMATVKDAGTSNAHIEYEYLQMELQGCVVKLGESTVNPIDYVEEICEGFQKAYRIFLKDTVVKKMLEQFFEERSRVVLRHTQQYFMYRFTSLHQNFCGDKRDRKELLAVLYKKGEDELRHRIHTYEIESLLEMDIPYFEVSGKNRSLYDGNGGEYENYFSFTPFDSWKKKIGGFGEDDLERQLIILRLSLELLRLEPKVLKITEKNQRTENRYEKTIEHIAVSETNEVSGEITERQSGMIIRLKAVIYKIATWILRTAVTTTEDVNWFGIQFYSDEKWKIQPLDMYLYGGIAGIVLFLAEYQKQFADERAESVFKLLKKKLFRYTAIGIL